MQQPQQTLCTCEVADACNALQHTRAKVCQRRGYLLTQQPLIEVHTVTAWFASSQVFELYLDQASAIC